MVSRATSVSESRLFDLSLACQCLGPLMYVDEAGVSLSVLLREADVPLPTPIGFLVSLSVLLLEADVPHSYSDGRSFAVLSASLCCLLERAHGPLIF